MRSILPASVVRCRPEPWRATSVPGPTEPEVMSCGARRSVRSRKMSSRSRRQLFSGVSEASFRPSVSAPTASLTSWIPTSLVPVSSVRATCLCLEPAMSFDDRSVALGSPEGFGEAVVVDLDRLNGKDSNPSSVPAIVYRLFGCRSRRAQASSSWVRRSAALRTRPRKRQLIHNASLQHAHSDSEATDLATTGRHAGNGPSPPRSSSWALWLLPSKNGWRTRT